MRPNNRAIVTLHLLPVVLGGLLCLYLVRLSFSPDPGRFCEILGTDCSAVVHGEFGSFLGFSVSSIGLSYYVLQSLLLITALGSMENRAAILALAVAPLGGLAAMASLYFTFIMGVVLKQGCAACAGVHVVNFALVLFNWKWYITAWRALLGGNSMERFPWKNVLATCLLACQGAVIVFLGVSLAASRYELSEELKKTEKNLAYYQYLHKTAPLHDFTIAEGDTVVGQKVVAGHRIVLFYKNGCRHCDRAKEKLTDLVKAHDMALVLIMKNYHHFEEDRLKEFGVDKVPAVFVDGRRAEGWEVEGFMDPYKDDCGC